MSGITAPDGGARDDTAVCPGCGCPAWPGDAAGIVPRTARASAGCWAAYRRLVALEYAHPERWAVRELTAAAWTLQHPGSRSRDSIRQIGVHLVTLHFVLERDFAPRIGTNVRRAALERLAEGLTWLTPPANLSECLDVRHMVEARDHLDHAIRARAWASSVWSAWAAHHDAIERWADWLVAASPPGFPGAPSAATFDGSGSE